MFRATGENKHCCNSSSEACRIAFNVPNWFKSFSDFKRSINLILDIMSIGLASLSLSRWKNSYMFFKLGLYQAINWFIEAFLISSSDFAFFANRSLVTLPIPLIKSSVSTESIELKSSTLWSFVKFNKSFGSTSSLSLNLKKSWRFCNPSRL